MSKTFVRRRIEIWLLEFIQSLSFDEIVKSQKINSLSFRRKPESSDFSMFWMPDRACPQLDWGSGMTKSDFLRDHQFCVL
jgi:hypothetical protein